MSIQDDNDQKPTAETPSVSRRDFVTQSAVAGAGFMIVPRSVLGRGFQAPSDTVNIATIGVAGMGGSNTQALMSQNIVAFCDVDPGLVEGKIEEWKKRVGQIKSPTEAAPGAVRGGGSARRREPTPAQVEANGKRERTDGNATLVKFVEERLDKVQRYLDYREMLEKQKDIDAVVVATPDHMHALIASAAMDLGKHVYVQKPLCWSVHEARHLAKRAKETKVVTQMGNQGHSRDEARLGYEMIQSGVIGDINEVHVWTNRPLGYWPQGVPRPAKETAPTTAASAQNGGPASQRWRGRDIDLKLAAAMAGNYPPPDKLNWDLFLGGAPMVEYHPIYHPFNWRGWVDWGQGALGDMGAHLIDHPFWSLELGSPTTIETLSTPFNNVCYPHATMTYYEFPARGAKPAVKLTWYDGGLTPPKPVEMPDEEKYNGEGGILYVGSKGKMLQDTYGLAPRLLPAAKQASYTPPKATLARVVHEEHEMNWIDAIKGKQQISSPFEFAAPLTEVMLLGIAALRAGGKIHYDAANMRITNKPKGDSDPNQFLTREYREGWKL